MGAERDGKTLADGVRGRAHGVNLLGVNALHLLARVWVSEDDDRLNVLGGIGGHLSRGLVDDLASLAISAHHNSRLRARFHGIFHHLGHGLSTIGITAAQIASNTGFVGDGLNRDFAGILLLNILRKPVSNEETRRRRGLKRATSEYDDDWLAVGTVLQIYHVIHLRL
jgi:hypothetical protein